MLTAGTRLVVSKKFLHFSKHHFPKDSESGLKSTKISSLSFLPDLNHPNDTAGRERLLELFLWKEHRISKSIKVSIQSTIVI